MYFDIQTTVWDIRDINHPHQGVISLHRGVECEVFYGKHIFDEIINGVVYDVAPEDITMVDASDFEIEQENDENT